MKTNSREKRSFFLIVSITLVGLILWLGSLLFLQLILRLVGVPSDYFAIVEALSTAITAAAVLGGGYLAYHELNEQAIIRYMEVADRLFEELNSSENIAARRWIFQELPENPEEGIGSLSAEGRDALKTVLNSLDRVAFLTQGGWIPDDMIMPWMNPMIVKVWIKLEPYVDYESRRRHEPDYYEQARDLAQRCIAWREQHLPDAKITWLDDAL
jgi:hypothetical protein